MYSSYRDSFIFAQFCGVQEEKCWGAGRNCQDLKASAHVITGPTPAIV